MKKLHSLFILSILALTMFVGCQMPTDGTDSKLEAEETEYTITVVAPHGTVELDKTKAKAGETVRILKYTADKGYRLKTANAYKDDNTLVEPNPDHTSFVMPSCNVKIVVEYEVISNDDDTPTETPTDTTPTVDADEATYGFVKTVNYTVVANGQSLPGTKTGAELIALAKEKNLVKDTDYTIDGTTVILTETGVGKYLGKTTEKYSLSVNASDLYAITGGGMKEAGKTVTLSITHYDGTDYVTPTATELYLVKVHIRDSESKDLNIPVTVTKDHKIQFTMPEKNIYVFAEFYDIRYQTESIDGYKAIVNNYSDNEVTVVLCFNSKAYDNLDYKKVSEKYVLEVDKLEKHIDGNTTKSVMYFTSLCDNELSKDGTLNDNQYTFGVIDNGELKILKVKLGTFSYNPNQGLQSN